jgi:RNA polymerase sigma-70 factor (ECF subfamily)
MTFKETPDEELVRWARDGDVAALEALYRAHVDGVYAICLRMVGDECRAEELTQDTWVRVWERLGSFRFESSFPTWLYRVATNVVLQSERSQRRHRWQPLRRQALEYDRQPQAETQRVVDRVALERAITRLPVRARAVLVLHDLKGYSHAEVAATLDIAEGTSRAHLFFAREQLRRSLTP